MQRVYSSTFWKQAAERAIKTFAQVLLVLLVGDATVPTNLFSIDWWPTLGMALGAAVVSVAMSVGSTKVGEPGSPSLVETGGRHAAR